MIRLIIIKDNFIKQLQQEPYNQKQTQYQNIIVSHQTITIYRISQKHAKKLIQISINIIEKIVIQVHKEIPKYSHNKLHNRSPQINKQNNFISVSSKYFKKYRKQLIQILKLVRKQTNIANQRIKTIRQQINKNKINRLQKIKKQLKQQSTQTPIHNNPKTRTRQYTFQDTNDDQQSIDILNKLQTSYKKSQSYKKQFKYIISKLQQNCLDQKYSKFIKNCQQFIGKNQTQQIKFDQISESDLIQWNKIVISLLLQYQT